MIEGPIPANVIDAVASYVDPKGIPKNDWAACAATQISDYKKYGTGFTSVWTCDQASLVLARWAFQDMGYKHVTVIGMDYAFGWVANGSFMAAYKKLGGAIDKVIWARPTPPTGAPSSPRSRATPRP